MAEDPMKEKERNAMRRRAADSLHALARKIENGDYTLIEMGYEFEMGPKPGTHPHMPQEQVQTGRQILTVRYDTRPRDRKW